MRATALLLTVVLVLLTTACGGTTPSASSAIAKVSPAVVRVLAEKSMGSGMILEGGYVLTNNHVVGKTKAAQVVLADGRKFAAPVFGIDKTRDLAILKISADNLPSVVLGKSSELAIGDEVIAVGFPLGSELGGSATASRGIVSAFRTYDGVDYVQTDASMNPGNSGGPLVNLRGEVVGVNTWGIKLRGQSPIEGMNFATAIDGATAVIPKLMAGETAPPPTPAGPKPEEYVIGRLLGLTGTSGFWGEGTRAASEMAAEEINAAGGVDGVPIRYIYYDTRWQAKPGVEGFTKLVDVDNVKVIGIGGSAVIPAVKPLAEEKKIPLINDAAYLEDSDYQGNEYLIGIQATRGQMNKGVIEILNTLGVSKIAIEYGNTAQTVGMANGIKKLWSDAGKQVVAFESHELDQKDFRSLVVKLKSANPDVVVHIPYAWSEAALFVNHMKELGWKPQVVSTTNMFGSDILKQAGDAVEGTIITLGGFNMFDTSNTKLQQENAKFKQITGHDFADYSDWAALAYDGTYMIAQAIRQGGYTSEGINNALHEIKDFEGVTGKMSIDPTTGLAQKTLGKAWVKNGQWTLWQGRNP